MMANQLTLCPLFNWQNSSVSQSISSTANDNIKFLLSSPSVSVVMEQPPGSFDELQPQDLSTSSIPTVIDLTRKGEECVLNANSLEALRMVKSPSWYPNSGTSKTGLPFSETASTDIRLQSGDQIQPDNAFSNTTVTLSYVSRSHVFSTHDSLSQHSPLYGVPSISKFSLQPPCDAEKGLGETGYALSQHYLDPVDRPVDLATQTELFQSLSQTQVGEEDNVEVCLTEQPCKFNGGVASGDGDMNEAPQGGVEHGLSRDSENSRGLENGQGDSWSGSGACVESSPETLTPVSGEHQDAGGSEVLFLISRTQEPVVIPDNVGARDLCSLSREYISPLEDPVSPSATSLDDVEDVFILPQASSSPSGDNSFLEATDEVVWDSQSGEGPIQPSDPGPRFSSSDNTPRLDTSSEHNQPVHRRKAILEPMIDLTDDGDFHDCHDVLEKKPKTVIPHMNGNTRALQRTLKKKKLPVRSGRGTRLEAIVMNINPGRYKVSRCIRTSQKVKAFQTTASVSKSGSSTNSDSPLEGKKGKKGRVKTSISARKIKQKASSPLKRGKTNSINTDSCKESTSDSEIISNSKNSHNSTPPKKSSPPFAVHKKSKKEPEDFSHPKHSTQASPKRAAHTQSKKKLLPESSPQFSVHKKSKKDPEHISNPDPSPEIHVARISPPPKSPKKSPAKCKGKAAGSKTSPAAKMKAARPPKRRRKKHKPSQSSSMFSPKEPEIKLKYVNYKEEKRDLRLDTFSPFIRVERKQSSLSLCTVINYPEEMKPQHKKGQQQQQQAHSGGFIAGVVPSTSCLQLGRASTHSQHQRPLICCLCGQSANAMDLGDLHGPYYPEGYQPGAKTPASTSGVKEDEEDTSDSDSSSCSAGGRRRKFARPLAPWPLRPASQLKQKELLGGHRWTSDGDIPGSPAAKRSRSDASSSAVEDWYSPPVVPLESCEYWLHEDCGIWSAGVFLVKGKVYGLEEAVKVAQETVKLHSNLII